MAVRFDETVVMTQDRNAHLDPAEVAAFVDRTAADDARRRIESHLAACRECRAEVAGTLDIVTKTRRRLGAPVWIAGVAAAALVAMVVWPRGVADSPPVHREAPVTTTIAPAPVRPVGVVDSATPLVWTAVPHADRYRLRVFTADGSVIWERESTDTMLALPVASGVRAGRTFYWSVEAQIGFDRAVASDLVEFSVRLPR